jgi:hypothetical protein
VVRRLLTTANSRPAVMILFYEKEAKSASLQAMLAVQELV